MGEGLFSLRSWWGPRSVCSSTMGKHDAEGRGRRPGGCLFPKGPSTQFYRLFYVILAATLQFWCQHSHLNLSEIKYKRKKKLLNTKVEWLPWWPSG